MAFSARDFRDRLRNFAEAIDHINRSGCGCWASMFPRVCMENSTPTFLFPVVKNRARLLQFPKLALQLKPVFLGSWSVAVASASSKLFRKPKRPSQLEKEDIQPKIKTWKRFRTPGTYGRALIFAGMQGYWPVQLCFRRGCFCADGSWSPVTVHGALSGVRWVGKRPISLKKYLGVRTNLRKYISEARDLSKYDAIAIGPARINQAARNCFVSEKHSQSLRKAGSLLDARCCLNLSAANEFTANWIYQANSVSLHQKEFERLFGESAKQFWTSCWNGFRNMSSWKSSIHDWSSPHRSSCPMEDLFQAAPEMQAWPAAGSGDVLTGIMAGLLYGISASGSLALAVCFARIGCARTARSRTEERARKLILSERLKLAVPGFEITNRVYGSRPIDLLFFSKKIFHSCINSGRNVYCTAGR